MDVRVSKTLMVLVLASTLLNLSCDQSGSSSSDSSTSDYLYVATGACYSGNNTTFSSTTSSNVVFRLNSSTGAYVDTVADYFGAPSNAGDSPVGIANADSNNIYVLVENSTTASLRRVELVQKSPDGPRQTFSNNTTALSAQLRSLQTLSNGDLLISKSSALEYLTTGNARIGNPYISASAAPCNTSTTLIPQTVTLSNGKVVFIHAAAAQNRIGIFTTAGGTTCATAQSAPNANAYPSSMVYDEDNTRLLVAYSGNAATTDLNSIYAYTINETTGAFSSPQKIYDAALYPATYSYLLYGVSAMTFDSTKSYLYIATAISTATTAVNYVIEKFRYDPTQIGVDNTQVLTRVGSTPFYNYGTDTRCISALMVAN